MTDIGIGIVGGGYMGKRHAVACKAVRATFESGLSPRLVSVAATSKASAERYAAAYGFEKAAEDWRALVDDPDIEAVIVTTYPDTHREIACAALEAGKHVLCEKPLAGTVEDARAMAEAARASGHIAMAGFNYRRTPATQFARALAAEGALGGLVHLRATHVEDYLADPDTPADRRTRALQGGATADLGSHALDMVVALVGPIARLWGRTEIVHRTRPAPEGGTEDVVNDDACDVIAETASGATVNLHVSRVSTGAKMGYSYELVGTKGAIRFDGEDQNSLHVYRADAPEAVGGFTRVLTGPAHPDYGAFCEGPGHGTGYGDQITIEIRDFLQAIETGEPPDTDFDHALTIQELIEAVHRSSRTGQWVEP